MAGVGDEIGVGAADIGFAAAVIEFDNPASAVEIAPGQLPQGLAAREAGNGNAIAVPHFNQPHCIGVPQRNPRILAEHVGAQCCPRGGIGIDDPPFIQQQQRLAERLNRLVNRIARYGGNILPFGLGLRFRLRQPERTQPQRHNRQDQPPADSCNQHAAAGQQRNDQSGEGNLGWHRQALIKARSLECQLFRHCDGGSNGNRPRCNRW